MSREPELFYIEANNERIAVFEWGKEFRGQEPSLLLVHATGFHARCWDQVISLLGDRHIIAIDQRGHGRSSGTQYNSWKDFGTDLKEVLNELDVHSIVAVGHSMGGYVAVSAAASVAQSDPSLFKNLILIDPVIVDPSRYQAEAPTAEKKAEDIANMGRRRNNFRSAKEMIDRFSDREPYSIFTPKALEDYCTYGLLPSPDGEGMVLACDPFYEASIYVTMSSDNNILNDVGKINVPVLVVRAMIPDDPNNRMGFKYSPTWPELASHFQDATDLHLSEHTHFIPMEDPALVAKLIKDNS